MEEYKILKSRAWFKWLKEYYEPEDVERYFNDIKSINHFHNLDIIPPEDFFTKDVLKAGLKLIQSKKLSIMERYGIKFKE